MIAYTGAGTTGKQEHNTQAVFNHTEDFVLFPDEATTSLCAWNSRNASRCHLMSLGHNGPVRHVVHSPTHPSFLTCSGENFSTYSSFSEKFNNVSFKSFRRLSSEVLGTKDRQSILIVFFLYIN